MQLENIMYKEEKTNIKRKVSRYKKSADECEKDINEYRKTRVAM